MSESVEPPASTEQADVADETPRQARVTLPPEAPEPSTENAAAPAAPATAATAAIAAAAPVTAARKRDRESALGSGTVTPSVRSTWPSPQHPANRTQRETQGSDDLRGSTLTPAAKKGRVQDVSSSPQVPRTALTQESSKADLDEEPPEASPSPPETPPAQSGSPSAQSGAVPLAPVPETARVTNIRQKVQRMSTGDAGVDERKRDAPALVGPNPGEDEDDDAAATEADELTSMTADAGGSDAGGSLITDSEDMRSVRAVTPSVGTPADPIAEDVDGTSVAHPATGKLFDSVPVAPLTPSPSKPVSSFASFSSSASPFASVPGSSRPSFGGVKVSTSPAGKVLPLSRPNLTALINATGSSIGPPSPASSIRAEIGSLPAASRSASFSGSTAGDSLALEPALTPREASPVASAAPTAEASHAMPETPMPAGAQPPPPTPASGEASLPAMANAGSVPTASAFAARFSNNATSNIGKAKSASSSASAFGSFSSTTSPFGSVRKSPYRLGARRLSQDGTSPEHNDSKSLDDLLKNEAAKRADDVVIEDDVTPKILFKEQEVVTGEEDEEVLHAVRGKLYVMEGGSWRERGLGQLRLNAKIDGGHPRLVMRADATHRLLLNAGLFPGFQVKANDRQVQFATVEDGKFVTWALKTSNAQTSSTAVSAIRAALDLVRPHDVESAD